MILNYHPTKLLMLKKIILLLVAFTTHSAFCQNSADEKLFNWFDSEIGKQNLGLNNGSLFNDVYPTDNKTNRYFENEKFEVGEVEFDNQYYTAVCINYDLLQDALLIKPYCENDRNSLILIKERNKSFVFKGKKFVNLNYNASIKNDNVNGYYEEVLPSNTLKFYTKYKKNKRDKYVENRIETEYDLKNEFCLFYKNTFHKIDSKNSITKLFPAFKTQINDFYQKNNQSLENDKVLFMKNLFNYINGLQ